MGVIERIEAAAPNGGGDRVQIAERIEAFTDPRIFRYWKLVGIVNGWSATFMADDAAPAWQWYAKALRAHSG